MATNLRLLPLVLAATSALLLSACGEEPQAQQTVAKTAAQLLPSVTAQTLTLANMTPSIGSVGEVQAAERIEMSVDFSAPVVTVHVREGESIQRGQLLLELDVTKLQLRVDQARQALQQAESRLSESGDNLKRREVLAQKNNLSKEALAAARHEYRRTQAEVAEVRALTGLAERDLADSRVVSPVDGLLDKQLVEVGETVQPGEQLLVLQATAVLEVETFVSERDINYVHVGAQAEVVIEGWQSHRYQAVVQSVGAAADSRTGNFVVKLLLQQRDLFVRPGMTAGVTITGTELKDMLLLPEDALVDRQRQRVVFVVVKDEQGLQRVALRQPRLKVGLGDQLVVMSGLSAGDQVVVQGQRALVDGARVSIDIE